MKRAGRDRASGFTLVELLVVIAVVGLLAALLLPSLNRAKGHAMARQCLSNMRQIAFAVRLYADDNRDELPRSQHSAAAHGQVPWGRAIAAELSPTPGGWTNLLKSLYHCPADRRADAWSFGQNVYFELDPAVDDYEGAPRTWRKLSQVPKPTATVLDAENAGSADHIMPHFWSDLRDAAEVDSRRHSGMANYSFVDGHVVKKALRLIYSPKDSLDAWNPLVAR